MRVKMLAYLLVLGLIANLSTACLDCPLDEGDRGKMNLSPISDYDYLKAIALANRAGLLGEGVQQKVSFYQKLNNQQHQKQRSLFSSPSSSSPTSSFIPAPQPSNVLHLYTLLNKGSAGGTVATDPKFFVEDYSFQDSAPVVSKISKKAEKGMLVDVMDYVSKSEDRNRRVGQNMRSSG